MSVLKAASEETLAEAFRSYAIQPDIIHTLEGETDDATITSSPLNTSPGIDNALCCVVIGLTAETESKYPQISYFINPLSLIKGSSETDILGKEGSDSEITINSRIFQIAPKCPNLFIDSKTGEFFAGYQELLSVVLPLSMERGNLSFWDTVKYFKDTEIGVKALIDERMDRGTLLRAIEINESVYGNGKIICAICQLLSHSDIIGTSYTLHLLAAYMQSSPTSEDMHSEGRHAFLIGSFSAISICCSLPDILKIEKSGSIVGGLLKLWCDAYIAYIVSLLEIFTILIAAIDVTGGSLSYPSSLKIASYFNLMQSLLSIKISSNNTVTTMAIQEYLQTHGVPIRNKMNKWIKSCLKFGLHSNPILNGLSYFFSATRCFFHASLGRQKEPLQTDMCSFWESIFAPKVTDFYHPFLVFQMIVSHSKFVMTLKGGRSQVLFILIFLLFGSFILNSFVFISLAIIPALNMYLFIEESNYLFIQCRSTLHY